MSIDVIQLKSVVASQNYCQQSKLIAKYRCMTRDICAAVMDYQMQQLHASLGLAEIWHSY